MATNLHITKPGHRCANPLRGKLPPASYCQAGEVYGLGAWILFYSEGQKAYIVCREDKTGDFYQFNNYNCAAAKLAELGGK